MTRDQLLHAIAQTGQAFTTALDMYHRADQSAIRAEKARQHARFELTRLLAARDKAADALAAYDAENAVGGEG